VDRKLFRCSGGRDKASGWGKKHRKRWTGNFSDVVEVEIKQAAGGKSIGIGGQETFPM